MAVRDIKLDPAGGDPQAEIFFGEAQIGSYQCVKWNNAQSTTPTELAHGNNVDQLPDLFPIGSPAASLSGAILGFSLLVQAPSTQPGQLYSYTIAIRQGGSVVPNGLIQGAGVMNASTMPFLEYVRFA